MLVALIFLGLILSTIVAYILRKRKVALSRVWLLLAAAGVVMWLLVLIVPQDGTLQFTIKNWYRSDNSQVNLVLAIDPINWPIVFSLFAIHIAFLAVSSAKQELERDFIYWIIEAGEIIAAFAALTAADLWTLIMAWTAMDVGNLAYEIFYQKNNSETSVILPMAFRLLGSLLLIFGTALMSRTNQILLINSIPASTSGIFFLAAILHCGFIPFRFPKKEKREIATNTNVLSYLFSFIASLFLIVRLPQIEISIIIGLLSSLILIVLFIYFGILWVRSQNELEGIYYLSITVLALSAYRYLNGSQTDLDLWYVMTLISGSWLVLFSHRGKSVRYFPIFLIISMLGIPFSLTSYGKSSLFADGFTLPAIFVIVFHVLYVVGFYTYFNKEREQFDDLDPTGQLNYLSALIISVISILLIAYRSAGSLLDELAYWWLAVVIVLAAVGIVYYLRKVDKKEPVYGPENRPTINHQRLSTILTFRWLETATKFVVERIRPLVIGFSNLMEGEGGILWAIVFMALLVTVLRTG